MFKQFFLGGNSSSHPTPAPMVAKFGEDSCAHPGGNKYADDLDAIGAETTYLSAAEPVALDTEMSTLKSSADGDFLAVALLAAWFGDTSSVTSQPWTDGADASHIHTAPRGEQAAFTTQHPTVAH